jgi:phosphoribosylaminoimidazolecarboxamide formyltransferase / IMP cyclohydrolase
MWTSNFSGAPTELCVPIRLQQSLRYGENPHQAAAFYADLSLVEAGAGGVASAQQHHGKEMSYNNYLDADAAYLTVCDFKEPACVVVKHTNPCGVAARENLLEAYELAVKADPISAFGGIVAFNRPVTEELAKHIREFRSPTDGETRMFYEIVIAPEFTPEGLACLKGKSKTLRILEAGARAPQGSGLRQVSGGWLWQARYHPRMIWSKMRLICTILCRNEAEIPHSYVATTHTDSVVAVVMHILCSGMQEQDSLTPDGIEFECVSEAKPDEQMLEDLEFAWLCVKHVKSNAITVGKGKKLLGMGSGQPNRVKSTQIALEKVCDIIPASAHAPMLCLSSSWRVR